MSGRNIRSIVEEIAANNTDWLPELYRLMVRTQRTRAVSIAIPAKENSPEIIYTLLGIELRVGRCRFSCPDLATARYMRIFARIGCSSFAIPYDITRVSTVADRMETAWHLTLLRLEMETNQMPLSNAKRVRSALIKRMRDETAEIGPGELMPDFTK